MKTKEKVEQGKGTADHLMPLGYLLTFLTYFISHCLFPSASNEPSFQKVLFRLIKEALNRFLDSTNQIEIDMTLDRSHVLRLERFLVCVCESH